MWRGSLQIKFTCKRCGATTIKPINPHAWATGTVFATCGCCQVRVPFVMHPYLLCEQQSLSGVIQDVVHQVIEHGLCQCGVQATCILFPPPEATCAWGISTPFATASLRAVRFCPVRCAALHPRALALDAQRVLIQEVPPATLTMGWNGWTVMLSQQDSWDVPCSHLSQDVWCLLRR